MTAIVFASFIFALQVKLSLQAAPPIEACPHDSIPIGDSCKCAPELCSKPPCLYDLIMTKPGDSSPGSCCPTYSCTGCPPEERRDGQCPCAPEAFLNSANECICHDPYKTLNNSSCVCDPDRCPLPGLCDDNSVAVSERNGCCSTTKCIQCPPDSYPSRTHGDEVESKCVCYSCRTECTSNEEIVIKTKGSDFPGKCCDLYSCKPKSPENNCAPYGEGDVWSTPDDLLCECKNNLMLCGDKKENETKRFCNDQSVIYQHLESWMVDSCTNCTCYDGDTKCISHICETTEATKTKPECPVLNCTKFCPSGYKVNKHGCQICRCNASVKCDDLLVKYHITKEELEDIVARHFSINAAEEPIPCKHTVFSSKSEGANEMEGDTIHDTVVWHFIVWSVVTAVGCIIAILVWLARKYRQRNRSYNAKEEANRNAKELVKLQNSTKSKKLHCNNNCYMENGNTC